MSIIVNNCRGVGVENKQIMVKWSTLFILFDNRNRGLVEGMSYYVGLENWNV